jgi:hypothetical protein
MLFVFLSWRGGLYVISVVSDFPLVLPGNHVQNVRKDLWVQMQTQFSGSAYQAKAILGAWHSGDTDRLRAEADRIHSLETNDSGEQERLELLAGIANELGSGECAADGVVYDSLLAHLAFPEREAARRRRFTRRGSGCARAPWATALQ